jgi:ELWxxDGT repeat protein
MKKCAVLVMLTVFLLHDLTGQTQLTDLSSPEGDRGSYPSGFVIFSNLLFFRASTESEGQEIWVNNGNETFLLKDIYPGNGNGAISNLTESAAELNGKLYFIAYDGEGGTQLWVTDATENGTQPISNIAGLSGNTKLTVVGNHIFFILTIEGKLEVWKSDGTEKGTVRVRGDIASENPPAYEGAAIGLFFFSFQSEGENGFRVWRSDGTGSGTFSVTNSIGTVSSLGDGPSQFIEYKNELYFLTRSASIFSSSTPIGIMKTDGTVENTVPVSGLFNSSIVNVQITHIIEINNKLYFSFYQYDFNTLLIWESDGSAGGTKHIFTLTSEDFFSPSNLATDGEDLIFVAANSAGNASLMRLDLDTYESTQIKDLNVKPARPIFYMRDYHVPIIRVRPDLLFFTIPTDRFNTVGWVADLSTDNTFPMMDMDNAEMVSLYNDHVYFTKPSNIIQPELWRSDFSFQEIELVANINTTRFGLFSEEFAVIEDKVFFVGNDVEHGRELWAYDTTKNTVILLRDIYEGATVPFWPVGLTPVNNKLYFSALSQEYGLELWQSDGTQQGTVLVEDFAEGPASSYPYDLFVFKGKLYFTLRIDNESFIARLENDSIEVLAGLGVNDYNIFLRLTGDVLTTSEYFYFETLEAGPALWRSDGTIEGTFKLKDMSSLDEMVLVGDRLYFSGRDTNANQVTLWTTDGNIANTQKLDVTTALGLFNIRHLGAFEDHLIFTAETEASGKEYWLSDGTVSGTRQLADLLPGQAASRISILTSFRSMTL